MEKIVLDTNILIEILKGNQSIISKLESSNFDFFISAITVMELYYGAFNKEESLKLQKFVRLFNLLEIDEMISSKSTALILKYAKSHNLTIPDALIASTAIENRMKLFTLNLKDFKYMNELVLLK